MSAQESHRPTTGTGTATGNKVKPVEMTADQPNPLKQLHVNFSEPTNRVVERKSKYLTAKYGQHQMSLIKKRLQVEMWLLDQLHSLIGDEEKANHFELDLDQLLDIDGDVNRRETLKKILIDIQKPEQEINEFIEQVLIKAKTL